MSYLPLIEDVPVETRMWENVYQTNENMRSSMSPVINSQTYKQGLPSRSMSGGAYSLDLPIGPLLQLVVLVLRIDKNDLVDKAGLKPGWGFRAISRYTLQADGSSPLTFFMEHMLVKVLSDCETDSKKQAVLNLSGPAYFGKASDVQSDLLAYVPLYLPFSNVSASRYIPYDSAILSKALNLNIELRSAQDLFTYSAGDKASIVFPTEYKDAYLMVNTQILAKGPISSIRNQVGPQGDSRYSYGWMYPSPFKSGVFRGVAESENQTVSVFLNNMRSGSLQSMDLFLIRESIGDAADNPMSSSWNFENFADLSNVEIRYGGQTVYRAPDKSYKMFNLSNYTAENQIDTVSPQIQIADLGAAVPMPTTANTSSWVHVQLSQFNENFISNLMQHGAQPQNNMMEVIFNTPEITEIFNGSPLGLPAPAATVQQPRYRLLVNLNYQCALSTYKGFTDFLFLSPSANGPFTMAS